MTYYAMADSRTITDYRPSRDINLELMKKFDIKDYNKYRFFMQKNGNKFSITSTKNHAQCVRKPE